MYGGTRAGMKVKPDVVVRLLVAWLSLIALLFILSWLRGG